MNDQKFEIESGIPIPQDMRGNKRTRVYPISELAKGQSFFVPDREGKRVQQNLSAIISVHTRRHYTELVDGIKARTREFTTRKVPGGVRVWRTK